MPLITWDTSIYSVQNETIDNQHKRLIELINELNNAMTSRNGFKITEEILVQTLDYAYYHFKAEEELMDQFSYPEMERHKALHDAFRIRVTDLRQRSKEKDATIPRELLMYLRDWLIKHITVVDKKLGLFLFELEKK